MKTRVSFEPLEQRRMLSATLYGSDNAGDLFRVSTSSGKVVVLGNMDHVMISLAEGAKGQLFGIDNAGVLYEINRTTAAISKVGTLSLVLSAAGTPLAATALAI